MILWIDNNNLLSVYQTKNSKFICRSFSKPLQTTVQICFESSDLSFSFMQLRKLWKWAKKVQSIIYVSLLCECQISFSLKYVSVWHCKTTRPKLHPFHFYFHFTWTKKMQNFSFQLLFLTSIHVNSLFKFILNDQETSRGASDWTVSKWPLLYVMGFRVFFHRIFFFFSYFSYFLFLLALVWHDLK